MNVLRFHNAAVLQYLLGFVAGSSLSSPILRFFGLVSLQTAFRFITISTTKKDLEYSDFNLGFMTVLQLLSTFIEFLFQSWIHYFVPTIVLSVLTTIGLLGALGSQLVLILIDLEVFTKDRRLRQIFSEVRLNNPFVPIERACFIAWYAYVQLAVGNLLGFLNAMRTAYGMYTNWLQGRKPVPIPALRDEEYRGILKLPLLDGKHTVGNVSLYSLFLGTIGGMGVLFSTATSRFATIGLYLFFLTLFHQMEYVSTVMFQPASLSSKWM
jgi:hypothetical protein